MKIYSYKTRNAVTKHAFQYQGSCTMYHSGSVGGHFEKRTKTLHQTACKNSHTVQSYKCLPLGTARSTCNLQKISGTDVTLVISYGPVEM